MIKIGMLIADRYEVLEKIGTGGMSDVYKAKDHKLNRLVAVKVLKQEFSENVNFVSKFRVEAQAAAGLMHPNIVNIYDVGEEKGFHYIVMELVDGITLKKYIEKKARLTVKEAVIIAIQVCMGLEAAHANKVIHRDIKPQNIIISKDGKVKVTDFGIAKAATSNTITSNVMGSVHYTSPEQARGGYSDEKSDVYSLGITLFEMLTGRVPFNGETTVAIAIKHIQQAMPSPKEYVPEIPRSVEQIVLKCCEKSPDRRYQNMSELIADLKRSLMYPEDDFVKVIDPDKEGATKMAPPQEQQKIQQARSYAEPAVYQESADAPITDSSSEAAAYRSAEYSGDKYPYEQPSYEKPSRNDRGHQLEYTEDPYAEEYSEAYYDPQTEYEEDYDDFDDDYAQDYPQPAASHTSGGGNRSSSGRSGSSSRQGSQRNTGASRPSAGSRDNAVRYSSTGSRGSGSGRSSRDAGRSQRASRENLRLNNSRRPYNDYEDDYEAKSTGLEKMTTVLSVIAAVLIGIVIIVLAAWKLDLLPGSGSEEEGAESAELVEIPEVTGQNSEEVRETLLRLGLTPEIVYAESSDYSEGIVISVDPAAGTSVSVGAGVTLTVSVGQNGIEVPDVLGMSIAEATSNLERKGFTVNRTEGPSDTYEKGLVAAMNPAGGTTAPGGSAITITISTGPDTEGKVPVPDLSGISQDEAMAILVENGLQLGKVTEVTNDDPNLKGLVCGQSEEADTYVDKDTAIDLQVSKGTGEATYTYTEDISAPTAAEDPGYVSGTSVYMVIITSDGTKLLDTTVTSFPQHVSYSGLQAATGTLQMSYVNTVQSAVTTDPETGETVQTEGSSQQKVITRNLVFTEE